MASCIACRMAGVPVCATSLASFATACVAVAVSRTMRTFSSSARMAASADSSTFRMARTRTDSPETATEART